MLQASWGRSGKQQQEPTSPNHVQVLFPGPVLCCALWLCPVLCCTGIASPLMEIVNIYWRGRCYCAWPNICISRGPFVVLFLHLSLLESFRFRAIPALKIFCLIFHSCSPSPLPSPPFVPKDLQDIHNFCTFRFVCTSHFVREPPNFFTGLFIIFILMPILEYVPSVLLEVDIIANGNVCCLYR